MTMRREVALDQSLESSRHRMMYSFCSIFARTMPSTCFALACSPLLRRPGAALIRPATGGSGRLCWPSCFLRVGRNPESEHILSRTCCSAPDGHARTLSAHGERVPVAKRALLGASSTFTIIGAVHS